MKFHKQYSPTLEAPMKPTSRNTFKGTCPACKSVIQLDNHAVEEGGYVDCSKCWELLEIVSVKPFKLTIASFGDDEGDDDYDDYDDEE